VPVYLQGAVTEGVAALDFYLAYDPNILSPVRVEPGQAAVNAGKDVQARLANDGQYIVLMFGLSQTAIQEGEVVRIILEKHGNPENGETPVSITNTKFASLPGLEIPSQGSSATLLSDLNTDEKDTGAGAPNPIFGGPAESVEPQGDPKPAGDGNSNSSANGGIPSGDPISLASGPIPGGDGALRRMSEEQLRTLLAAQTNREALRAAVQESTSGVHRAEASTPDRRTIIGERDNASPKVALSSTPQSNGTTPGAAPTASAAGNSGERTNAAHDSALSAAARGPFSGGNAALVQADAAQPAKGLGTGSRVVPAAIAVGLCGLLLSAGYLFRRRFAA
jgi:hypothetical protein